MKKRTQSYLQQTYDEALLAACESGDAERVRAALKDGANPNRDITNNGCYPFIIAMPASVECARLLLEAGADPNLCDYDYEVLRYMSALDYLIPSDFNEPANYVDMQSFSYEEYLNVSESWGDGLHKRLALLDAYGAVEGIYTQEHFLRDDIPEDCALLLSAIRAKNTERVESLLSQGVEPQCRSNQGYSALALAARYGQLPMVQLLLDYGAAVDDSGIMRDAARSGNLDILRELLPFLRGRYRSRELSLALFPAAARGRVDILQFLIEHGADVNHQQSMVDDTYHRTLTCTLTPLLYTIINNQRAAHDLLIAADATCTPLCIP